jgi:hypothetical protein
MRTLIIITILLWVDNSMAQIVNNPQRVYDFNKKADRTEAMNLGFYGTGPDAVKLAKQTLGDISPMEELLISHEGFTTVPYLDTKNIKTIGVGQTGEYYDPIDIKTGFKQAVADKMEAAGNEFGDIFKSSAPLQQGAILSLLYRGDTRHRKGSKKGELYKWVGKYKDARTSNDPAKLDDAFEEFWDNKEYKDLMVDNPNSGVLSRIRENSEILFGKTK